MAEDNNSMELDGMLKALWDSLTGEQKEKARKCTSNEELMTLAGREGIELPDELLDAVAGGVKLDKRWASWDLQDIKSETLSLGEVPIWCPFCQYRHRVIEYNVNLQPPKEKCAPRDQPYRYFQCNNQGRYFFVGTIDQQIYDKEGAHWAGPSLGADLYGC